MFGRKKKTTEPPRRSAAPFPMIGVGLDDDGNMDDGDVDDAALEDELMDLLGEGGSGWSAPRKPAKRAPVAVQQQVKRAVPAPPKQHPASAGATDGYGSGDDGSDVNEDEIGDLEDELHGIINEDDDDEGHSTRAAATAAAAASVAHQPPPPGGVSLGELKSRLGAYVEAEKLAKSSGDAAKARRFGRAIKTLNGMIGDVSKGKLVKEDDVPPLISVSAGARSPRSDSPAAPQAPRPVPVPPSSGDPVLESRPTPPPRPSVVVPSVPLRPAPAPPPPPPVLVVEKAEETAAQAELLVDLSPPTPATAPPVPARAPPPPPSVVPPTLPLPAAAAGGVEAEVAGLKMQALAAKKAGDKARALELFRRAKELESNPQQHLATASGDAISRSEPAAAAAPAEPAARQEAEAAGPGGGVDDDDGDGDGDDGTGGVPKPSTVLEALEQRLAKFQSVKAEADAAGNARKVRQYGRIVSQYQDAIKDHRRGRPIAVDELPTPPGFPPIPVEQPKSAVVAPGTPSTRPATAPGTPQAAAAAVPGPLPPLGELLSPGVEAGRKSAQPSPVPSRDASPGGAALGGRPTKIGEQLALVKQKQHEYKVAALDAKRRGDVEKAKELLKISRGFDPMIESLEGGRRVDVVNMPSLPNLDEDRNDFTLVSSEERILPLNEASFDQLEETLTRQYALSLEFREYFKKIGDVIAASRFENRMAISKQDLSRLAKLKTSAATQGPKIVQETRKFFISRCNPDLGDDDVEVKVIKGTNYNFKDVRDADTYIKVEFPNPTDNPQRDMSKVVKDSVAPEYNLTSRFQVNRKARGTIRVFSRAVKVEVWKQGGWFKGASLYGTALVKLKPLELQCNLHDTFDLMDGRKAVGGNVEVSIRMRNPMLKKETEEMTKRWTIVDWDSVA